VFWIKESNYFNFLEIFNTEIIKIKYFLSIALLFRYEKNYQNKQFECNLKLKRRSLRSVHFTSQRNLNFEYTKMYI
jgi:hypothetical protein